MYLITVARAEEAGRAGPLPVADLAGALSLKVASANEMIRKLAGKGLVEYLPYKGVELTVAGRAVAARVLRTRRLWATFLAQHLDFSAPEADALACHLEHVTPPDAAERLAAFLGDPVAGPLGHPIPPGTPSPGAPTVPLTDVPVGGTAVVEHVQGDTDTAAFCASEGLVPGAVVAVRARGRSGILVARDGTGLHLGTGPAGAVRVREVHDAA